MLNYSALIVLMFFCIEALHGKENHYEKIGSLPDINQSQNTFDAVNFKIDDWGALGSGCRGGSAGKGSIKISVWKSKLKDLSYRLVIDTGDYGLQSSNPPYNKKVKNFTKQCGIRFAFKPKDLYRVTRLNSSWGYSFQKNSNVKLALKSILLYGTREDDDKRLVEKSSDKGLESGSGYFRIKKDKQNLRAFECGKATILGMDLLAANIRENLSDYADIKVKDRQAVIDFTIEKCSAKEKINEQLKTKRS